MQKVGILCKKWEFFMTKHQQTIRLIIESGKYQCCDCGKCFRDNETLTRHKNRKTPCFIAEIKPEDKTNPN